MPFTQSFKRLGGQRLIELTVVVVAVSMGLYHLVYTQYILQTPVEHQNTHYGFALALIFLLSLRDSKKLRWLSLLLLVLSVISTTYVAVLFEELEFREGFPNVPDLIIGTLLLVLGIEATRRAFGLVLPLISLALLMYTFFGHLLPGPLWHYPMSFGEIISRYSIGLTGIYGTVLRVSANYIFLFVLFGGLLMASGATDLFLEVGKLVGRRLKGGPAMTWTSPFW